MSDYTKPEIPKGGRGLKAPYTTQTVRVPSPCIESIQSIINGFRLTGELPKIKDNLIDKSKAIETAQDILTSRMGKTKSAKYSMEKLLQVIYGEDITL